MKLSIELNNFYISSQKKKRIETHNDNLHPAESNQEQSIDS